MHDIIQAVWTSQLRYHTQGKTSQPRKLRYHIKVLRLHTVVCGRLCRAQMRPDAPTKPDRTLPPAVPPVPRTTHGSQIGRVDITAAISCTGKDITATKTGISQRAQNFHVATGQRSINGSAQEPNQATGRRAPRKHPQTLKSIKQIATGAAAKTPATSTQLLRPDTGPTS